MSHTYSSTWLLSHGVWLIPLKIEYFYLDPEACPSVYTQLAFFLGTCDTWREKPSYSLVPMQVHRCIPMHIHTCVHTHMHVCAHAMWLHKPRTHIPCPDTNDLQCWIINGLKQGNVALAIKNLQKKTITFSDPWSLLMYYCRMDWV